MSASNFSSSNLLDLCHLSVSCSATTSIAHLTNLNAHKSQVSYPGLILYLPPYLTSSLPRPLNFERQRESFSSMSGKISWRLPLLRFATRVRMPISHTPMRIASFLSIFTSIGTTKRRITYILWRSMVYGKGLNIHDRSKSSSLIDMA